MLKRKVILNLPFDIVDYLKWGDLHQILNVNGFDKTIPLYGYLNLDTNVITYSQEVQFNVDNEEYYTKND